MGDALNLSSKGGENENLFLEGGHCWGGELGRQRNHRAWGELFVVEGIVREGRADGGHLYDSFANFRPQ